MHIRNQQHCITVKKCCKLPLVFSKVTHSVRHSSLLEVDEVARTVESEFYVWYLEDATLGAAPEKVLLDLQHLINLLQASGLEVNGRKCELTILVH